ncbi:MAG: hypothetical protein E5W55_04700 [Mesorhizobium sp.]|nr:MAG: hypothetical protein E5W55_04700 [Mesorhizobium sp.]
MGLVLMSEREFRRIEVLSKIVERRMTNRSGTTCTTVAWNQEKGLQKIPGVPDRCSPVLRHHPS